MNHSKMIKDLSYNQDQDIYSKNLDNNKLSNIHNKPKLELKTKPFLLKSLVQNIEDETEDTYYENSERSFIENLSICKYSSNGIITESLNTPTVSEINITPAVVSIINTKSENSDLKQDLEHYRSLINKNTVKNNSSDSSNKSSSKSKFFSRKFFSHFRPFGWFDSKKRNNGKIENFSSLSQSSTINNDDDCINETEESSSSSNNNKDQTDNEKSEITLISSHQINFEFSNIVADSSNSKESSNSKTFIDSKQHNSVNKNKKQILDNKILLNNPNDNVLLSVNKSENDNDNENDNENKNINDNSNENENKNENKNENDNENKNENENEDILNKNFIDIVTSESIIPNNDKNENNDKQISKNNINKEKVFENGIEDSSLFSSSTLFAENLTFTEIPSNIENNDNCSHKNDIEDIYKIEKFNESHILSTSSPKLENEKSNDNIENIRIVDNIEIIEEKVNDIMNKMEKNMELGDDKIIESEDSSNISSSEIALLEYETESEVYISNKMSNFDSDIEVEIIAISSPKSENETNDLNNENINNNENDSYNNNTLDNTSSESKQEEAINNNEINSLKINNLNNNNPVNDVNDKDEIYSSETYNINENDIDTKEYIDSMNNSNDTQINNVKEENISTLTLLSKSYNTTSINTHKLSINSSDDQSGLIPEESLQNSLYVKNSEYKNNLVINKDSNHNALATLQPYLIKSDSDVSNIELNINDNSFSNINNDQLDIKVTQHHISTINSKNTEEIEVNVIEKSSSKSLNNLSENENHNNLRDSCNSFNNLNIDNVFISNNNHEQLKEINEKISSTINEKSKIDNNENNNASLNKTLSLNNKNEGTTEIENIQTGIKNIIEEYVKTEIEETDTEYITTEIKEITSTVPSPIMGEISSIVVSPELGEISSIVASPEMGEISSIVASPEMGEISSIVASPEMGEISSIVASPEMNEINNEPTKLEDEKIKVEDKKFEEIKSDIKLEEKLDNHNSFDVQDENISVRRRRNQNQLKSVLKTRNRHSFPECGANSFELSLLTHIPLNQIGDKENKIDIPGVETIVVRQRRKSVNFDRNAFEKVCYFTSTEKPEDIHSRDVQIKEDEQSSNSIQTLLNTEVQKLVSDEVTGKGEYSNLGKNTSSNSSSTIINGTVNVINSTSESDVNNNTSNQPTESGDTSISSSTIDVILEPSTLADLNITSEYNGKIPITSLPSLTSLSTISDSISISKDSASSSTNTLSITIKAEIEQEIKNKCLLKDSSLKLNDPSSSWSPIPRNVIHLPKIKHKDKNWEPHIVIESFELVPRFEGQTQDMWDVLQVKLKVQNLDYHKKVFIRYSTDSWASYKEEEAKYSCCIRKAIQNQDNSYNCYGTQKTVGLDRFIAKIDASDYFVLPDCGRHTCMQRPTTMLLVARYEVQGTTYWDNNHFTDYKLELVRIPAGYDVPRHHGHSKAGDASIIACAACAEEKREAELANIKKLQKEDEKEKKERTKVRHLGGGKALLSDNFSVMDSNVNKDFTMDPNNIYAKELMKVNENKKKATSTHITTTTTTTTTIKSTDKKKESSIHNKKSKINTISNKDSSSSLSKSNINNQNNYQNYHSNYVSSMYSYDPYSSEYNSCMSVSSLYSSDLSDVYTYGGGISEYDSSYYTSDYSYNPNLYSSYGNTISSTKNSNNDTNDNNNNISNINNNETPYGYGRSRSYSTGSIYSSDYYQRKNYFGNDNSSEYPVYSTNKNSYVSSMKQNIITNSEASNNPIEGNVNNTNNINTSNLSTLTSNYANTYNPSYQYNYNFGANRTNESSNGNNNNKIDSSSQSYNPGYSNSKYNLYNYDNLYSNSPMSNLYNGYSNYNNLNSSMLNDTNAFY